MKGTLAILAVILLAVAGIGFWQGWFSFAKDSKVGVTVDTGKMDQDKKAFSKAVGDKVASLKETLSGLWKKSETVKAEEATAVKKELEGLNQAHEDLEKKIKGLVDTDHAKFEEAKTALEKSLVAVDAKIQDLAKRIEKAAGK